MLPMQGARGSILARGTRSHMLQLKISHAATKGFPGGSEGKESACKAGGLGSIPGLGRSPGEGIPVFLSGEFHGQRRLVGYSPWGGKESDTTERLSQVNLCPPEATPD